ncbi:MAG: hypothetical protein JST01_25940, partial [Cyanobacteria bacterium SZAS TMP-1]|nr:hypothetical protein [Cyanobacteria bacterium SZAS TMP-1]
MTEGNLLKSDFPGVPEELKDTVTISSVDMMIDGLGELLSPVLSPITNYFRSNSVWPLTFGT